MSIETDRRMAAQRLAADPSRQDAHRAGSARIVVRRLLFQKLGEPEAVRIAPDLAFTRKWCRR